MPARYRLDEELDRGASTQLFRAHDTVTDRDVTLVLSSGSDDGFAGRARLLARIDDPHVPAVLDIGDNYFVTRSAVGRTLLADGPLSPQQAVDNAVQIGDALDAAHAVGLVHGEVRPANITVGNRGFAWLSGFGHAGAASTPGRFAYLAPERFESGDATAAGDIYALACLLYQCLTGRTPYPGDTLEQQVTGHLAKPIPRPSDAGAPAGFDTVIATGLAKDPGARYSSAGQLVDAARAALPETVIAPPDPVAPDPIAAGPLATAAGPAWFGVDAAKVALVRPVDVPEPVAPVTQDTQVPAVVQIAQVPTVAQVAPAPEPPISSFTPGTSAVTHHVEPDDADAPPISYGWPSSVNTGAVPPPIHPQPAQPDPPQYPQYNAPATAGSAIRCAHRTLRVHGLSQPEGIAVDAVGTVFIADWDNDRIIAVATGTAPTTLRFPGLNGPVGITLGDGALYVTDSGNYRVLVRQDRGFRAKALPFTDLDNPQGIAVDLAGWIYVADWGNDRVVAFTADGRLSRTLPFPELLGPQDVAMDGAGTVYVTDAGNNRVLQLPAGATAPIQLPFTGLKAPHGIAIDRAGTVYVTDRGNNRVVLMTADRIQHILRLDGLDEPGGIAVDLRGTVYLVDEGNNRVLHVTPLP